jgi:hypothetical protein
MNSAPPHPLSFRRHIHIFAALALVSLSLLANTTRAAIQVIEAKPIFSKSHDYTYLEFKGTGPYDFFLFSWPRLSADVPNSTVKLDTNAFYKFTVANGESASSWLLKERELVKIEQGTNLVYDASICEAHAVRMELRTVPIRYGLILGNTYGLSPKEYYQLEQKEFPLYEDWKLGGCVTSPDSPKTSPKWVCLQCKTAFTTWQATRPTRK